MLSRIFEWVYVALNASADDHRYSLMLTALNYYKVALWCQMPSLDVLHIHIDQKQSRRNTYAKRFFTPILIFEHFKNLSTQNMF